MSRRIQFSLVLVLACFAFLIIPSSNSYAVEEVEQEEPYPGLGGDDGPPDDGGEGGDPEEILIRSRPVPPVEDQLGSFGFQDSSTEWLLRLVNAVRIFH